MDIAIVVLAVLTAVGWYLAIDRAVAHARTQRALDDARMERDVYVASLTRTRDALARTAARALAVPALMEERDAMMAELNRRAN